jgi:hypothetical protein
VELDWSTHELTNSWSSTLDFHSGRTIGAYKYEVTDQPGDNYWNSDNLIVEVDDVIDLHAMNSMIVGAQGGRQIVIDSDIDLQTSGQLQVDGTPGVTMSGYYVLDINGDLHSVATTKGLVTTG